MKICVTGGSGFIGSHLVDALMDKKYKVFVIDNLSTGKKENLHKSAKFYLEDIRSDKINQIFQKEKPDYVYHLAAQMNVRKSLEDSLYDCDVNILGSLNILNSCIKHHVKKVIFSSSGGAVYGEVKNMPIKEEEILNPISPYGITKMTIENYLHCYKDVFGLDNVILRYANVYGERQDSKGEAGIVSIFADKCSQGQSLTIYGTGKQTRDYIYIKDVISASLLAMKLEGTFNVGTGKETSVEDMITHIEKILNVKSNKLYEKSIRGEVFKNCLNSSSLQKNGFDFNYSLEEGLRKTINYFQGGYI